MQNNAPFLKKLQENVATKKRMSLLRQREDIFFTNEELAKSISMGILVDTNNMTQEVEWFFNACTKEEAVDTILNNQHKLIEYYVQSTPKTEALNVQIVIRKFEMPNGGSAKLAYPRLVKPIQLQKTVI